MSEHLSLRPVYSAIDHLTVAEILGILIEQHLAGKACARPFNSNRKAVVATCGNIFYDALTEPDLLRHVNFRRSMGVGPQTIRHDLKLITMAYNMAKRYKRNRWTVAEFNFTPLILPEEDPAKYIRKPKTKPRKRPVSEMDFSKWIEHCHPKLAERSFFAIDTGLNPKVLMNLRVSDYNMVTDCLDVQRGKTGEVGSLPVTRRCREIIIEAIAKGQEYILDWTNHDKQVKAARKLSGVYFWFGRDLRTSYGNKIFATTKSDQAAQKAMLHRDPRTFVNHYKIDHVDDLRGAIQEIEKSYA